MKKEKQIFESLLEGSGVSINGNNPEDLQVHNENFYRRVLTGGSLGLGESYMDGWWDCQSLDEFINKILVSKIRKNLPINFSLVRNYLVSLFVNQQSRVKAQKVIDVHYDLGNDLYQRMLDKRMV